MSITFNIRLCFLMLLFFLPVISFSQEKKITGKILSQGIPVPGATIKGGTVTTISDSAGNFSMILHQERIKLITSAAGFSEQIRMLGAGDTICMVELFPASSGNSDVVITGTLKEVQRMESPVPVEVYTPVFFKKNPTPNIFDALQNVNGVRPQLNCNVCNTGDIHINGLEGPYTMVLIDGMPIVSSLATVYGLSGIPNSLVERIEIVKGPASSLYGSEAVGGLINIITKKPASAPRFFADVMTTSWNEFNADIGFKAGMFNKAIVLTGVNYFKYADKKDLNNDLFTDVTLQERISVFQKWSIKRKHSRQLNLAMRFFYEDRWGGDMRWNKLFRGGDSIYGESIYTRRSEIIGNYQLPVKEKMMLSFSFNDHNQDSRYGLTSYIAKQQIIFTQLIWDKQYKNHDLLAGAALRSTFYDDNSVATAAADRQKNQPHKSVLPGVFLQDEINISHKNKLLLGFRYDYNAEHGNIFTPRLAYKWTIDAANIFRLNAGTGFRVVNLFTEDHAALTGARKVEIKNELKPEKSYNVNLNYIKKIFTSRGTFIGLDLSVWYTYFNNRITADYNSDPDKIIYDNLSGHAISKGVSANLEMNFVSGIKVLAGTTFQDVANVDNGIKLRQLLTESVTGTWAVSYRIKQFDILIDYTGNVYGPMQLPLAGPLDPRRPESPVWSIQNLQFTFNKIKRAEIYAGIKNILNWTPGRKDPFIIARTHDPFDKQVQYDNNGKIKATPENPHALTFDPNYLFAPNQGRRIFIGTRISFK